MCIRQTVVLLTFFHCSHANWFWSGCETLLLGGTCATVAFVIGFYVNDLLGEGSEGIE